MRILSFLCVSAMVACGSEIPLPKQGDTKECDGNELYQFHEGSDVEYVVPNKKQRIASWKLYPLNVMTVNEVSFLWSFEPFRPVAWTIIYDGEVVGSGNTVKGNRRYSMQLDTPVNLEPQKESKMFELVVDTSQFQNGHTLTVRLDQLDLTGESEHCLHEQTDPLVWRWHFRTQLANYVSDVATYAAANGLTRSWVDFMVAHQKEYAKAYVLARLPLVQGQSPRTMTVHVSYLNQVIYNPAWQNEAEHFAALKHLLELQFAGWNFEVSGASSWPANIEMVLGEPSISNAIENTDDTGVLTLGTVYLHFETIAAHEIAHLFDFPHHQPVSVGEVDALDHSEEGLCIMRRDGYTFGHIERFLLDLNPPREGEVDEIKEAIKEITSRYP